MRKEESAKSQIIGRVTVITHSTCIAKMSRCHAHALSLENLAT